MSRDLNMLIHIINCKGWAGLVFNGYILIKE